MLDAQTIFNRCMRKHNHGVMHIYENCDPLQAVDKAFEFQQRCLTPYYEHIERVGEQPIAAYAVAFKNWQNSK